jgi:hypothetical protein
LENRKKAVQKAASASGSHTRGAGTGFGGCGEGGYDEYDDGEYDEYGEYDKYGAHAVHPSTSGGEWDHSGGAEAELDRRLAVALTALRCGLDRRGGLAADVPAALAASAVGPGLAQLLRHVAVHLDYTLFLTQLYPEPTLNYRQGSMLDMSDGRRALLAAALELLTSLGRHCPALAVQPAACGAPALRQLLHELAAQASLAVYTSSRAAYGAFGVFGIALPERLAFTIQVSEKWCRYLQAHHAHAAVCDGALKISLRWSCRRASTRRGSRRSRPAARTATRPR